MYRSMHDMSKHELETSLSLIDWGKLLLDNRPRQVSQQNYVALRGKSRFSSTNDNLEHKQCVSKLKNYTPNGRVARGDLV